MAESRQDAFPPGEYRVKLAGEPRERRGADRLRRAVFCDEQGLFRGDDRDSVDPMAVPIVALACVAGVPDEVVGTVRIHQAQAGVWLGSRLAVARDHRRVAGLGPALIRLAVGTAHGRGCRRFLAHVQHQNAALFHALHWRTLDVTVLHGRPHHFMEADLAYYPPLPAGEIVISTAPPALRRAA